MSDARPTHSSRRPWYDLGFSFTPKAALVLLALLASGVALTFITDAVVKRFVDLQPEQVRNWIDGFGLLAPLVYIALVAVSVVFSPLPAVPIDIAGGLAFGVAAGTFYTLVGAMIGASVNFAIARRLGRHYVARRLGTKAMGQIDAVAERMGAKVIFLTRLLPLFNFDWISYGAGLTAIRFRTYFVWSAAGIILPLIGITYVGDVLLTHPGRSAAVFGVLVVWSAVPPAGFLLWAGSKALHRRIRRPAPARTSAPASLPLPVEVAADD